MTELSWAARQAVEYKRAVPTLTGVAAIEAQLKKSLHYAKDDKVLDDSVETLREVLKGFLAYEFPGMDEEFFEAYEDILSAYPPEALT